MLARGFLRSRRTAVGVATVRGPMQYVTAAGIVVFDGERVVSVEIAMESEATVVVGLSRYVDSEFVTSSAVASIDHPGKGAALAAIDASGAPYVTLVVVRGSYVGRVSVVVVCESGSVTPAIRALALPARILPVRQVRGAALLAVAESVTAAPGCFVVQQTRQMSTTLFVVELIELDGSKHELVAGELSIVEVSSRLAVSVARYVDELGRWTGFSVRVTEPGWERGVRDHKLTYTVVNAFAVRAGERLALALAGTRTQSVCLLAPLRLVAVQPAVYAASATKPQYVRFRPLLYDALRFATTGPGLACWADDEDSFVARDEQSRVASPSVALALRRPVARERAVDDASATVSVAYAAETATRVLSVSPSLVVVTRDVHCFDAGGVATGAKLVEGTRVKLSVDGDVVLVPRRTYGALVRSADGMWDAVDEGGEPMFVELVEPWMLEPPAEIAPHVASVLSRSGAEFHEPGAPQRNAASRYRVAHSGAVSVRVEGPRVYVEGTVFEVRASARLMLRGGLPRHALVADAATAMATLGGQSYRANGTPTPLGRRGLVCVSAPANATALRCFDASAPPEPASALLANKTYATLRLFLVDARDGTLRTAHAQTTLTLTSVSGGTVASVRWATTTVDGSSVRYVEMLTVVPASTASTMRLELSVATAVADARYEDGLVASISGTVYVDVPVVALGALSCTVYDASVQRGVMHVGRTARLALRPPEGVALSPWERAVTVYATCVGYATSVFDSDVVATDSGVEVTYEPPQAAAAEAKYTDVKIRLEASFVVVRGGVGYRAPYAALETTVRCGPEPAVVQLDDNGDGTAKLTLRDATMRPLTLAAPWAASALRGLAKRGQDWVLGAERTATLEAVEVTEGGYFVAARPVRVYSAVRAVPDVELVFSARGETHGAVELRFEETASGAPLVPVTAASTVTIAANGTNVTADVTHFGLRVSRRALLATARAPGAASVRVRFDGFEVRDEMGRRCSVSEYAMRAHVAPTLVVARASLRLDVPSGQPAGLVVVRAPAELAVAAWGLVELVDSQDVVHASGAFEPTGAVMWRKYSARPDAHEPLYVRLLGARATFLGAPIADLESAEVYATAPVPYAARVERADALGVLVGVYDAAGAHLRVDRAESGTVAEGYVRLSAVAAEIRVCLEGQVVVDTVRVFRHRLVGPYVSGTLVAALEAKQQTQSAVYELVDHEGKPMSVKTCSVTTAMPPPYRRSVADASLELKPSAEASAGKLDATLSGLYGVAGGGTREFEATAVYLPTARAAVAVCTASGVSDAFAARVRAALTGISGTCDVGRTAATTDAVGTMRGTTSAPDLALVDRTGRVVGAVAQAAPGACRVTVSVATAAGAKYEVRYSSSLGTAVRTFEASGGKPMVHGTWAAPMVPGTTLSATAIECGVGRVEINALLPVPTVTLDGRALGVVHDAGRWLVRHAFTAANGATYAVAYFGGVAAATWSVVAGTGPTELGTVDAPVLLGSENTTTRCGVGRVTLVLALPCVVSVHRVPTAKFDTAPMTVALAGTRYVASRDFTAASGASYTLEFAADATTKTTLRSAAGGPSAVGTDAQPATLGDTAACGVGAVTLRVVVPTVVRYVGALALSGFELNVAYVEEGEYVLRSERYASETAKVRVLAPCPARLVTTLRSTASVAATMALEMQPNYACVACTVASRGAGYASGTSVTVPILALESAYTLAAGDVVVVESEIEFAVPAVVAARPPSVLCATQLVGETRVAPALSKPTGTAVYRFHPHAECTGVALTGATLSSWNTADGAVRVVYASASGTQLTATLTLERKGYANVQASTTTALAAAPASVAYTGASAVEFRDADGRVCVFGGNRTVAVTGEVQYAGERRFTTSATRLAELCFAVGDTATVQSIGTAELLDEENRIVATYVGGNATLTGLEVGRYSLRRRASGATVPVYVRAAYKHAGAATVRGLVTFDGGSVDEIVVPAYPAGGLLTSWSGPEVRVALGRSSAVDAPVFTGTGAAVPLTLFCEGVSRLSVSSVTSIKVVYFSADGVAVGVETPASAVTTTGFTMPNADATVASASVRVVAKVQQLGAAALTDVTTSRTVTVYKRPQKYCVVFGAPPSATETYDEIKQRAAQQWGVKTASAERVFVVFDAEVAVVPYEVVTSPAYTRGTGAATVAFAVRDAAGAVEAEVLSVSVDGAAVARVASAYTIDASEHSVIRVEVRVAGTVHALFLGERPMTLSVTGSGNATLRAAGTGAARIVEFVGLPASHNGNYGFALSRATVEAALPEQRRCGAQFTVTAEHSGTHELSSMTPLNDVTCTFACTDAVPRQGSRLVVSFTSTSKGSLKCDFAQVPPSMGASSIVSRALEIVVASDYAPRASVAVTSATLVADTGETLLCSVATLDVSTVRYLGMPRFAWQDAAAHALTGGAVHTDVRFRAACALGTEWSGATLEVRRAAGDGLLGSATVAATATASEWGVGSLEVARSDGSAVYVTVSKDGRTWRLGASGTPTTLRTPMLIADVEAADGTSDEVTMTEIEYTINGRYRAASVRAVTARTRVREAPTVLVNPKWKLYHEADDADTATLEVALVDETGRSTMKDVRISIALRAPLSFALDDEHVAALATRSAVHAAVLRSDRALGDVTSVTATLEDGTTATAFHKMHDASTVICCVPSRSAVASLTVTAYLQGESSAKRREARVVVGADKPTAVSSRAAGSALGATIVLGARTGYVEGLEGVWLVDGAVFVREQGLVYATAAMTVTLNAATALAFVVRGGSGYIVLGGESAVATRRDAVEEPQTKAGACTKLYAGAPFASYNFERLVRFARGVAGTSALARPAALALDDPLGLRCGLSVAKDGEVLADVEGIESVEVLATATATTGTATTLVRGVWCASAATAVACVRVTMGGAKIRLWPKLDVELTMCTGSATGATLDVPTGSCVATSAGVEAIGAVDVAGTHVAASTPQSKIPVAGKTLAVATKHGATERYVAVIADAETLRVAPPMVYRVAADATIGCYNLTADAKTTFVRGTRNVVHVAFETRKETVEPWHTETTTSVEATVDGAACTVLFVRTAPFGVWLRFDGPEETSVPLVVQLKAPGGVSLRPVSLTLAATARKVGYDASATEATLVNGVAGAVEIPSAPTTVTSAVTVTVIARMWRNTVLEPNAGFRVHSANLSVAVRNEGPSVAVDVPGRTVNFEVADAGDGLRVVTVRVEADSVLVLVDGVETDRATTTSLLSAVPDFVLYVRPTAVTFAEAKAAVAAVWVEANGTKAAARAAHVAARQSAAARDTRRAVVRPSTFIGARYADAAGNMVTTPAAIVGRLATADYVERRYDSSVNPTTVAAVRVVLETDATVTLVSADDEAGEWVVAERWTLARGVREVKPARAQPRAWHAVRVAGRAIAVHAELHEPSVRVGVTMLAPTLAFAHATDAGLAAKALATLGGQVRLGTRVSGGLDTIGAGTACVLGGVSGKLYDAASPVPPYVAMTTTAPPGEDAVRFYGVTDAQFDALSGVTTLAVRCEWLGPDGPVLEFETWSATIQRGTLLVSGAATGVMQMGVAHEITVTRVGNDARVRLDHRWPTLVPNGTCALRRLGSTTGAARLWLLRCGDPVTRCVPLAAASDTLLLGAGLATKAGTTFVYAATAAPAYALRPALSVAPRHAAVKHVDGATQVVFVVTQSNGGTAPLEGRLATVPVSTLEFEADGSVTATATYGTGLAKFQVMFDGEKLAECAAPTFYSDATTKLGSAVATALGTFTLATSTTHATLVIPIVGPTVAWKSVAQGAHTNAVVKSCLVSGSSVTCEARASAAGGARLEFALEGPDGARVTVGCDVAATAVLDVPAPTWEVVTLGALKADRTGLSVVRTTFAFGTAETAKAVSEAIGATKTTELEAYIESTHAVTALSFECTRVVEIAGRKMYEFKRTLTCGYDPSAVSAGVPSATHGLSWPLMVGASVLATWTIGNAPAWTVKSVAMAAGFTGGLSASTSSRVTVSVSASAAPATNVTVATAKLVGPDKTEFDVALTARPADVGVVPWAGSYKTSWTRRAVVRERAEVSVVFAQAAALGECTCVFASAGQTFTDTSDAAAGTFRAHFAPTTSGTHTVTATMKLAKLSLEHTVTCAVVATEVQPSGTPAFAWDGTALTGGESVQELATTGLQTGGKYIRMRRSGPEKPTSVMTLLTLDLSEAADGELLARGFCPGAAASGRALTAAEEALGLETRLLYVRGHATPVGSGNEYVDAFGSGVLKYRVRERDYITDQPSCYVIVVDTDATPSTTGQVTLFGVSQGGSADPGIEYDGSVGGVFVEEQGNRRSVRAVRHAGRIVCQNRGRAGGNMLYSVDATAGTRSESAVGSNWTGGTTSGWLSVYVHPCVKRAAFFWGEATPDVEPLLYMPPPMSSHPGLRAYAVGDESGVWLGAYGGSERQRPSVYATSAAMTAEETALGMPARFVYVKGLAEPIVGAQGAGEFVKTVDGVREYRIRETDAQRSCYVLVMDVALEAVTSTATLVGVYSGAVVTELSGDPELHYDTTSGIWAYEHGMSKSDGKNGVKRSEAAVRGTRLVYKVKGDKTSVNRLYAIDASTGARTETVSAQTWTTGTNGGGWLHVRVHEAVERVAFFWANLAALPDVEPLLATPTAGVLALPRTSASCSARFAHYNTSAPGQRSYVARLGGRRVEVPYVAESGTTAIGGVHYVDHWFGTRVTSAACFTSSGTLELPAAWATTASPLWPAAKLEAPVGVPAAEYAAWVEATFDGSMIRPDGSAVPTAQAGLLATAENHVPRWLTPTPQSGIVVESNGWFVRWGYQRPQIVRRVALRAEKAHSGCTFELRGCDGRNFGSAAVVATATTVGTTAHVWTAASRIMAYTHFEFAHVSGTAQQGLFFLRLGE